MHCHWFWCILKLFKLPLSLLKLINNFISVFQSQQDLLSRSLLLVEDLSLQLIHLFQVLLLGLSNLILQLGLHLSLNLADLSLQPPLLLLMLCLLLLTLTPQLVDFLIHLALLVLQVLNLI